MPHNFIIYRERLEGIGIKQNIEKEGLGVRTFFSRLGGKILLRKKIIKYFPLEYSTYIEPFVGSGALFFQSLKKPKEIINDLDKDLVDMFRDIRRVNKDDIVKMNFDLNKERFDNYKNLPSPTDYRKRLERNIYISRGSFAGMRRSFSSSIVERGRGGDAVNRRLIQDLDCIQERLKGVEILNTDYKKVIKMHNSPSTFIYLDPPYFEKATGGYPKSSVSPEELYDNLKSLKSRWLMSYNDHPLIRQIFKDFYIKSIDTTYVFENKIKGRTIGKELLISNYPLVEHPYVEYECSLKG